MVLVCRRLRAYVSSKFVPPCPPLDDLTRGGGVRKKRLSPRPFIIPRHKIFAKINHANACETVFPAVNPATTDAIFRHCKAGVWP